MSPLNLRTVLLVYICLYLSYIKRKTQHFRLEFLIVTWIDNINFIYVLSLKLPTDFSYAGHHRFLIISLFSISSTTWILILHLFYHKQIFMYFQSITIQYSVPLFITPGYIIMTFLSPYRTFVICYVYDCFVLF